MLRIVASYVFVYSLMCRLKETWLITQQDLNLGVLLEILSKQKYVIVGIYYAKYDFYDMKFYQMYKISVNNIHVKRVLEIYG